MELDLDKPNELLKKARVKRGYMTVRRIGEGKEEEEVEVRITGDQCLTTTFKYRPTEKAKTRRRLRSGSPEIPVCQ